MPRTALTVIHFLNPDGTPVALGKLSFRLNTDGSVNNTQVSSQPAAIPLDSSGTITGSPTFWPNSSISPAGTYYVQLVYNALGQLVSGPRKITV